MRAPHPGAGELIFGRFHSVTDSNPPDTEPGESVAAFILALTGEYGSGASCPYPPGPGRAGCHSGVGHVGTGVRNAPFPAAGCDAA